MRGTDAQQSVLFRDVTLSQRIPMDYPLRRIRTLVGPALLALDAHCDMLYSSTCHPSIAPDRLLRALVLMVLCSIRSERQLIEQLNDNLLFRWFVGLERDDAVWDVTVFTKNRELLLRDKVESSTDADGRLYKKARPDKSVPCYLGHALMETRSGLVVAAEASFSGNAVALTLLDRVVPATAERAPDRAITLGADTMYQDKTFVKALRERQIAPHVPEYPAGTKLA